MKPGVKKPYLGFLLSLATAFLWGVLPVALKELLQGMDASTLVWYRFLVAFIVLFLWLSLRQDLPALGSASKLARSMILIAALGLCSNYFLFSYSLNFVNAETSEAVIQLTTLFLILGGVFVYRESFDIMQRFGTGLIVFGLLLFFHDRLRSFFSFDNSETLGVVIVIAAAVTWTVYALLQKHLLQQFTSVQILLCIYALSVVALIPFIAPEVLFSLSPRLLLLLAFCCLNTLVAYGCFAEALNIWDASKVSATLALAPLFTIATLKLIVLIWPEYAYSDRLSWLSLAGAALLVLGSALTALVPVLRDSLVGLRTRSPN